MPFQQLGLHPELLRELRHAGFEKPTPIQAEAIPPALARRDVLGSAETGSGKTAAYLLPLLHHLREHPTGRPRALVLVPTRELAMQVLTETRRFGRGLTVRAMAIFGGVPLGPQRTELRRGVDLIVATPGRLLDHLGQGTLRFQSLDMLVLDEADRMLDMGFLPDVKRILHSIPKARQKLLFSATLPPEIASLARSLLHDPVRVDVARSTATPALIEQKVYPVNQDLKSQFLVELLRRDDTDQVLVFTRTKHRAERLAKFLTRNGVPAAGLHGDRSQSQRTRAMADFRQGGLRVLVGTDLLSRGIDVISLPCVINFDVPRVPEDYVHRIGRTGRAGGEGLALTMVAPDEEDLLRDIERTLRRKLPRFKLETFDYSWRPPQKAPRSAGHGGHGHQGQRPQPHGRPSHHREHGVPPRHYPHAPQHGHGSHEPRRDPHREAPMPAHPAQPAQPRYTPRRPYGVGGGQSPYGQPRHPAARRGRFKPSRRRR